MIDACAEMGLGGVVFWRREIGNRATQIGAYAQNVGLKVAGLCRTPFLVGPLAPQPRQAMLDDFEASIDMTFAMKDISEHMRRYASELDLDQPSFTLKKA